MLSMNAPSNTCFSQNAFIPKLRKYASKVQKWQRCLAVYVPGKGIRDKCLYYMVVETFGLGSKLFKKELKDILELPYDIVDEAMDEKRNKIFRDLLWRHYGYS